MKHIQLGLTESHSREMLGLPVIRELEHCEEQSAVVLRSLCACRGGGVQKDDGLSITAEQIATDVSEMVRVLSPLPPFVLHVGHTHHFAPTC